MLTARRADPMQQLAARLRQHHSVQVVVEPADLGAPDSAAALMARLDARGVAPEVLVNNPGFGLGGPFFDHAPELRSGAKSRGAKIPHPRPVAA